MALKYLCFFIFAQISSVASIIEVPEVLVNSVDVEIELADIQESVPAHIGTRAANNDNVR